jgi:carbonic anhydrase
VDIVYRFDSHKAITRCACADPAAALEALREGNERFATIVGEVQKEMLDGAAAQPIVIPTDPLSLAFPVWDGEAPRQAPFALVLGCSDARVPVEVIFDQGCNALFVVRVAGNVLGVECLGSIDYAVRHLGKSLQALVVLGHSGCGAVTAAVDAYLSPDDYSEIAFTHALRSLVDRVQLAVRGTAKALERAWGRGASRGPNYRAGLVQAAVYLNAAVTAFDLRRELAGLGEERLRVVYGVYDLATQRVRALPAGADASAFGEAPRSVEELTRLTAQLAECLAPRGAG